MGVRILLEMVIFPVYTLDWFPVQGTLSDYLLKKGSFLFGRVGTRLVQIGKPTKNFTNELLVSNVIRVIPCV